MAVLFSLTNLKSETSSLSYFGNALVVQGELNGSTVTFTPSEWGTSMGQRERGISDWTDEVPPGISIKAIAIFDINPHATNLRLVLKPSGLSQTCKATIYLEESPVQGNVPVAVPEEAVNIRQGPGTNYPIIGKAQPRTMMRIIGKNESNTWWQVNFRERKGWVFKKVVSVKGPVDRVPVVKNIPAPPPTPTPFPKVRPSKEFVVGIWGLRLYDVKKVKAVYYFGDATVAHGVWLIPMVEIHNLGSGTADPSNNLDFYLQDSKGRTYQFDEFSDAVLGAAWEFQTGKLYDDINPGIVIGTSLPFDVPPDLGDVWLRVKQDKNMVMYLGNVSQIPEGK